MARLPRDTRLAILTFAILMLLLAVASWFGYDRWQALDHDQPTEGYR